MKAIATTLFILVTLFGVIHAVNQLTDIIDTMQGSDLVLAIMGQVILILAAIGVCVLGILTINKKR